MRSSFLSDTSFRGRTPGVILLARDLKALISRLGFSVKHPASSHEGAPLQSRTSRKGP